MKAENNIKKEGDKRLLDAIRNASPTDFETLRAFMEESVSSIHEITELKLRNFVSSMHRLQGIIRMALDGNGIAIREHIAKTIEGYMDLLVCESYDIAVFISMLAHKMREKINGQAKISGGRRDDSTDSKTDGTGG